MGARQSGVFFSVVVGVGLIAVQAAWAQPLNTNLSAYHIFAMQTANLKNYQLLGACNTGVNCAQPSSNSDCGVHSLENAFYADGSQIAGDVAKFTKPGASIWQLFSSNANTTNVLIRNPGPLPNGSNPFTPPILGDLDMDGNPSCQTVGQQCVPDFGDLEVACGFPNPFPACNVLNPVLVLANSDCTLPVGVDVLLGNGRCDLPAGVYGNMTVQDNGNVTFVGGAYTFCSFVFGKSTSTIVDASATIAVNGDVALNNDTQFAQTCNDIQLWAKGPGGFTFGRNSNIAGKFCAPERAVGLGHNNDLTGQFAGDTVRSDSNNRGLCCDQVGCACIDDFSPKTAIVGDDITLTGGCDLTAATGVTICNIAANIITKTEAEIVVDVPAGAMGPCPVKVQSASGVFTHVGTLQVN
jgi:hypothetical protein